MKTSYTAVVQQHGEWWIGWVEEPQHPGPAIFCRECSAKR